jgi:hypothetical protein
MIGWCGGPRWYQESRFGKGLGLLPGIAKRWPLCLRPARRDYAQAGLKLLQPTASEFGCMSSKGERGFQRHNGLDPGYPQRGPYEASEGIYPGRGQGETGGGQDALRALRKWFSDKELPSNCLIGFIAFGIRYLSKELLGAHDGLHCCKNVIAGEGLRRPAFRGIQGETKQSRETATLARRSASACRHSSVANLFVFFAFNPCPGQGHRRSAQKCLDKSRKEFKAFFVNWRNENSWFGLIPTGLRVNFGVLEKTAYEVQEKTGLHSRKKTKGGL